jgi:hypothetical protein
MTLSGLHEKLEKLNEEIGEIDDYHIQNLKGFAPEEFEFLMNHEKAYIAKRE